MGRARLLTAPRLPAALPAAALLTVAASGAAAAVVYTDQPLATWTPDAAVGAAFVLLAVAARRASPPTALLALAVAAAWWAAALWPAAVYAHRPVLVHLLLSVPAIWPRTAVARAVVVGAYVVSLVPGAWDHDVVAVGVLLLVVAAAAVRASGRGTGRGGAAALIAASFVVLAVCGGTVARATLPAGTAVAPALLGYDVALVAAAGLLGWAVRAPGRTRLTDVVVELGTARLPDVAHVAAAVGADPALRSDAALEASLAAARDLESGNERLRATVRSAVQDLDQSRHRLVVAEDAERARLSDRLGASAVQPLQGAIESARAAGVPHESLLRALRSLEAAVAGLRPPELDGGLAAAVRVHPLTVALGARLDLDVARCDATTEAVLYAVCSEALGNIAKHAAASQVSVVHTVRDGRAELVVTDDGVGSAGQDAGTGLTGLADRVAALGGTLAVEPVPARVGWSGTQVKASVPVWDSAAGPRHPSAARMLQGGGTAPGGDRPRSR